VILIFTVFVAFILYGLFIDYSPVLAGFLIGLTAFLGGVWAGIDERLNQ
jgi:hypothetical protein